MGHTERWQSSYFTAAARAFRRRLFGWFARVKRELPWRGRRDAYAIWVAEVMLQQTRAAAVIPYYERFLERFPGWRELAGATERELLACWAGLGYYRRARNLRKAARRMEEEGGFPETYEGILALPGVGEYTAAAVASIAFGLPHAVLDGNVARVMSRLTCEAGEISSAATRRRLKEGAEALLDTRRPGEFNQAMMELGATVCLPRDPHCLQCPVSEFCQARKRGRQGELPVKARKRPSEPIEQRLLVIERNGRLLMWQRPADSSRLAGFFELPEAGQLPEARPGRRLGRFRHTITHHNYECEVVEARLGRTPRGFTWVERRRLESIPVSTAARKALAASKL